MHTNKVNGKRYIGITKQSPSRRWSNGLGYRDQIFFWRAIQKYGWNEFEHKILYNNLTVSEAEEKEAQLIAFFNSNDKNFGYNILKGGSAPLPISDETRNRISKNHADVSGCKNPMYGVHLEKGQPVRCLDNNVIYKDVQTAAKELGLKAYNIWQVLCRRQKSTGGYHFVYEQDYVEDKWYNSEVGNNKQIICTDTGEIFHSIKECAKKLNLDDSGITKVCRGKQKHIKGFHFQYWRGQNNTPTVKEKFKKVLCLNNHQEYKSPKEAADVLGLDRSSVAKVCRGKLRSTGGYNFKYT